MQLSITLISWHIRYGNKNSKLKNVKKRSF